MAENKYNDLVNGFMDEYVLVRTYSAGVHFGVLRSIKDKNVILTEARRIHRWRGANTLHEISLSGIEHSEKGYSRVSKKIEKILLTEAIEILHLTDDALQSLVDAGWAS